MIPPAPQAPSAGRAGLLARITSPAGLAVAALAGLTLVFYYRLWSPGLVLIKRDAFRFHLPLKQYLLERLSAGELPQWFPYEALGRPFIGATATGVFHPFTALYFLLPVPDAYRASTLLSCLLAATGAFVLGRMLQFSHAGALLAGLAFALSGYVASLTENLVFMYSACTLPIFCAALEKALVDGRAWAVAPAVIWAAVFLMGDIQTGYYYLFIAVLWAAARAPGSHRRAFLRLALVGVLAALLAGIQLGPAWAVFAGSDRAQPAHFHEQALHWSTHPLRVLTMAASPVGAYKDLADIARFFFDNPARPASVLAESLYLGIPVMGLATLGGRHRRDLLVLTLMGALALFLALGKYGGLYDVFYRIVPLWSAFRYPEKLMGIVSFAAAMLAGAGFDSLRAGKGRPALWLAAALLCAGTGLWLRTEAAGSWAAAHFGAPEALARSVTDTAAHAVLFSAAGALGMWLLAAGIRTGRLREALFLVAFVTIVACDLARANHPAYHTAPVEAATFQPPLVEELAAREGTLEPGRFRLISLRDSQYIVPPRIYHLLGHDAQAVEGRQALALEHNASFHIETVYYYLPGLKAVLPPNASLEVAARYNTAYYVGRRRHFTDPRFAARFVAALPDYDLALFHNPAPVKPRAYLSRRPEPAASPADPATLFSRPDFLNGEVDVIETTAQTLPESPPDGVTAVTQYAPEDVRVRVDTPQPAVLVLLDAFDAGWSATLESGVGLPILRANALVRAVAVPAGAHTVTFSYQTPLLKAGAWASLAGVLLCLGLLAHEHRRGRHA